LRSPRRAQSTSADVRAQRMQAERRCRTAIPSIRSTIGQVSRTHRAEGSDRVRGPETTADGQVDAVADGRSQRVRVSAAPDFSLTGTGYPSSPVAESTAVLPTPAARADTRGRCETRGAPDIADRVPASSRS